MNIINMNVCYKCDIESIDYEYEKGKVNYVFAALNSDPDSLFYQDTDDYFDWIFSCSCYYLPDDNITVPKYNLRDKVWFTENKLIREFDTICIHIKKCYLARRIDRNHIFDTTNPIPNWVKNYMGQNYIKESKKIIDDLKPIRWGNNTMRHGIGKVKIFDYNKIKIIQYKKNKWECTCSIYNVYFNCSHINKYMNKYKALQNRRELCINLAHKYFESYNHN